MNKLDIPPMAALFAKVLALESIILDSTAREAYLQKENELKNHLTSELLQSYLTRLSEIEPTDDFDGE